MLDRLVLTPLESIWQVHETDTALDDEDRKMMEEEREVTLALVRYSTPLAAVTFPRFINTTTEMQAAAPAVEITRLFSMVGVGLDVLRALAGVLLLTAALSVFIALWGAVPTWRCCACWARRRARWPACCWRPCWACWRARA